VRVQSGRRRRRAALSRWWLAACYRGRGWLDGRRGLPGANEAGIVPSPTLHRLARDTERAVDGIRADLVHTTAPLRLQLTRLADSGGQRDRAVERLREMERRLENVVEDGIQEGRRYGEHDLPAELVRSRRAAEFRREVRQARKRVEDERTRLSDRDQQAHALRQMIAGANQEAAAAARLEGGLEEHLAAAYLDGALRSLAHRPLLNASLPYLTPGGSDQVALTDSSAS